MRAPSTKALVAAFRISRKDANLVRKIAHATSDRAQLERVIERDAPEATKSYVRSLHGDPYDSQIWRVTVALHAINEIVYKRATDTLSIGDWGSIVERHPSWEGAS